MIWRCPKCKQTVDGPSRPAPDDPCRLCSSCTLRFGELVHRRRGRRSKKAPKVNPDLGYMWHGMNLRKELRRLVEFCPSHVRSRPPSLMIVHGRPQMTVGWADFMLHRIELLLWPRIDLPAVLSTLVHELAHFCHPGKPHSYEPFRMAMVELVRDGYGVEPQMPHGRAIGKLDMAIDAAFVEWDTARREEAR